MKVAGVITEYNPFHNGHKYQLEQIKRQTSADYIVVVMVISCKEVSLPSLTNTSAHAWLF